MLQGPAPHKIPRLGTFNVIIAKRTDRISGPISRLPGRGDLRAGDSRAGRVCATAPARVPGLRKLDRMMMVLLLLLGGDEMMKKIFGGVGK